MLVDMEWQGKPRKLMLLANRNGFFYVLDRVTGQFLMAKAFVKQTLERRLRSERPPDQEPGVLAEADGRHLRRSGHAGRHQLVSAVIQPAHRTLLRPDLGKFRQSPPRSIPPATGRNACATPGATPPDGGRGGRATRTPANFRKDEEGYGAIRALDPKTGEKKWEYRLVNFTGVRCALDGR